MARPPKSSGFSLVELMIAVGIMAILAAIAIPGYTRLQLRAKSSEAANNLGAIRTCEVAYQTGNDVYAECAPTPDGGGLSDAAILWDNGTGGGMLDFENIGHVPEGPVRYKYQVTSDGIYFLATALGDLDDDGRDCVFSVDSRRHVYPKVERNVAEARAAAGASADADTF